MWVIRFLFVFLVATNCCGQGPKKAPEYVIFQFTTPDGNQISLAKDTGNTVLIFRHARYGKPVTEMKDSLSANGLFEKFSFYQSGEGDESTDCIYLRAGETDYSVFQKKLGPGLVQFGFEIKNQKNLKPKRTLGKVSTKQGNLGYFRGENRIVKSEIGFD